MRNRAERRHNNWRKAIRRRRIERAIRLQYFQVKDQYDNLHQYSKGRIKTYYTRYHKTSNCGRKRRIHANYAPSTNWSARDKRRVQEMEEQTQELDSE